MDSDQLSRIRVSNILKVLRNRSESSCCSFFVEKSKIENKSKVVSNQLTFWFTAGRFSM